MSRYIDADALKWRYIPLTIQPQEFVTKSDIENAPTADVRENVHAHWEKTDGDSRLMCSVCKSREIVPTMMGKPIVWSFCPNCGAKMGSE